MDSVFNIAKGRVGEFHNRVDSNDPANAAFIMAMLAATGLETHAALRDLDTFTALVAGATNEATNTGYARKTITDADIVAFAPDDTNDHVDLDMPDQTFTGVAADGTGNIGAVVIGYDSDTTGGTDANIVPCTLHDFAVTPTGGDITVQIGPNGWFRAS